MTKIFNGKAIYSPSGKAGEYSYWACNFYTGCSNDCKYCYCKRGVMSHVWSTTPKLNKCFKDEEHALEVFEKELLQNIEKLQKHGLFLSFTTDPMLPETIDLTLSALSICHWNSIPTKILTKKTDWIQLIDNRLSDMIYITRLYANGEIIYNDLIAFGFTLTGYDELEPNASTNSERIEAMRKLHNAGFKTFASIEPIIDFKSSLRMLGEIYNFCDLAKVGLQSGRKYDKNEIIYFMKEVLFWASPTNIKLYFKDSLLQQACIERSELPENCVGRDYNMFNQ